MSTSSAWENVKKHSRKLSGSPFKLSSGTKEIKFTKFHDSNHPISLNLDGNELIFENHVWKLDGEHQFTRLKEANRSLQEENQLLKFKLDVLLDMGSTLIDTEFSDEGNTAKALDLCLDNLNLARKACIAVFAKTHENRVPPKRVPVFGPRLRNTIDGYMQEDINDGAVQLLFEHVTPEHRPPLYMLRRLVMIYLDCNDPYLQNECMITFELVLKYHGPELISNIWNDKEDDSLKLNAAIIRTGKLDDRSIKRGFPQLVKYLLNKASDIAAAVRLLGFFVDALDIDLKNKAGKISDSLLWVNVLKCEEECPFVLELLQLLQEYKADNVTDVALVLRKLFQLCVILAYSDNLDFDFLLEACHLNLIAKWGEIDDALAFLAPDFFAADGELLAAFAVQMFDYAMTRDFSSFIDISGMLTVREKLTRFLDVVPSVGIPDENFVLVTDFMLYLVHQMAIIWQLSARKTLPGDINKKLGEFVAAWEKPVGLDFPVDHLSDLLSLLKKLIS